MRFGGHETFPVREGWFHKGLKLLVEEPQTLIGSEAADVLGVGNNMAKSIRHWLRSTGLAEAQGRARTAPLGASELGQLVWEADPYFLEQGTWWVLHINLVVSEDGPGVWRWFFNEFLADRFERPVCQEAMLRFFELTDGRTPSPNTLKRDLACLLATYGRVLPPERLDPEESKICPFSELGLLDYYRSSGYYERRKSLKAIPSEIFGYALQSAFGVHGRFSIPLNEVVRGPLAPAKLFGLSPDSLLHVVERVVEDQDDESVWIETIAGERFIRFRERVEMESERRLNAKNSWLAEYYSRVSLGKAHVA